jgi:crotonobetainyl-CoA:carnitine CoA-transferase CaiB-like acyl-CoA transferase
MQPLSGLLVLDFTTLLPGPLATLMLAEAGADVIKIERPGGEEMRHYEPRFDGESAMFTLLNRGKKSLVLDLKNKADCAKLKPLIARADILVEQFRPGVMARLGFGYDEVRAINPKLIYCSITGYGQSGPRAGEAGHDLNYIGITGLLALNPGPADRPVVPPALIADIAGGTLPAVMNILLALRQRDKTAEGCSLDIAMTDAMFTFASHALASGHTTGEFPDMGGARLCGGSPRYQIYPTRDGKFVCCAALEQKFWDAFTAAIGLDPKSADDRNDPMAVKAAVAAIVAGNTADEWRPVLAAADCCVTIMATLEEALHDPHFAERGLFAYKVAGPSGAAMPALPVPIDPQFRSDPNVAKAVPKLGAGKP